MHPQFVTFGKTSDTKISLGEISDAGLMACFSPHPDSGPDEVNLNVCIAASLKAWGRFKEATEIKSDEYGKKLEFLLMMTRFVAPRAQKLYDNKSEPGQVGGTRGSIGNDRNLPVEYWLFWFPRMKHAAIFLYSKEEEAEAEDSLENGLRADIFDLVNDLFSGNGKVLAKAPKGHPANPHRTFH